MSEVRSRGNRWLIWLLPLWFPAVIALVMDTSPFTLGVALSPFTLIPGMRLILCIPGWKGWQRVGMCLFYGAACAGVGVAGLLGVGLWLLSK